MRWPSAAIARPTSCARRAKARRPRPQGIDRVASRASATARRSRRPRRRPADWPKPPWPWPNAPTRSSITATPVSPSPPSSLRPATTGARAAAASRRPLRAQRRGRASTEPGALAGAGAHARGLNQRRRYCGHRWLDNALHGSGSSPRRTPAGTEEDRRPRLARHRARQPPPHRRR